MPATSSFAALPRAAKVLLVGVAIDALGTGLALPLLVVYLHDVRGLPLDIVGVLAATPPFVALCLLGPLGVWIDRFGPRRVNIVALAFMVGGTLLLAEAATVPAVALALAAMGVGHAAFWPANQALVAEVVPSAQRPRYFGISFALLNAGIGLGGLVAAFVADVGRPSTFEWLYRGDALTFLVPLALLLGPLRHIGNRPRARTVTTGSYRDVAADGVFRRYLVVVFLSAFVGYGVIEAGWAGYARTVAESSTRVIGLAFTANTFVIVLAQLVVLRLIEGRRRTSVLAVMAAIWAVAWAMLGAAGIVPGATSSMLLLIGSLAVFGLGETLLSPVQAAVTNDLATDRLRGRYNALGSWSFQVAAVAAPAVAGVMLDAGLAGAFIGVLLGGCALLAVTALRLARWLPPVANGLPTAPVATADQPAGAARSG
jgi:MFS family permease